MSCCVSVDKFEIILLLEVGLKVHRINGFKYEALLAFTSFGYSIFCLFSLTTPSAIIPVRNVDLQSLDMSGEE